MSLIARQSTARTLIVGPVLDADGVAVTDGVVGDFKISKNGGAPAALNGSATLTHRHTGFYSLALTASDLDTVGQAEVTIDDTVNSCGMRVITVVEEAVYDIFFAASATGAVPVASIANNAITTASINDGALTAAKAAAGFFDAILTRDWTSVSGEASRSVLNALRFLRNKWSISGTTLTITEEDDTTSAWTATVTPDAAAEPITGSDPS